MSTDLSRGGGDNRRQFFRTAAALASTAALPVLFKDTAQAAGRHSDPAYCEPVCLLRGSRIRTLTGDVAIEALKRGDLIVTESGGCTPVKWIGRKVFRNTTGKAWAKSVDPVRVSESAISPGVPSRDVFLSPRHALYIDGYLIPVQHLVNGVSITQGVHEGDVVEYFHVECEQHEVMFAENLAVETLQLHEMAEGFSNFAERQRLYGDRSEPMQPYAPVLGYWSRRDDIKAYLREICSVCIDVRDPIQVVRDRIALQAKVKVSALA
ncbi:MAG: hypothetical protein JWN07_552 [Hyphomicrobiales bacterium]|nr:hypothetical protein [Hyphomicrobiales bacterium]